MTEYLIYITTVMIIIVILYMAKKITALQSTKLRAIISNYMG